MKNNTIKKLTALLLAVFLLVGLMPTSVFADELPAAQSKRRTGRRRNGRSGGRLSGARRGTRRRNGRGFRAARG